MTERVWMYWEDFPGHRRPAYLDLCFETIRRHAGAMEVVVVDRGSTYDWLPDLDRRVWEALPTPVYRSDYARTRLVHRYGGLWLDFDVIAMAPLTELLPAPGGPDVVGWGAELGRFYNNLFAARPGASLVEAWIAGQDAALAGERDWTKLSWSALGQDVMWPFARGTEYLNFDRRRIAPVLWYEWRRFFSSLQSPREVLEARPVTVMLWNKAMGPPLRHRPAECFSNGRDLLSRLLRIGLGATSPSEECGGLTRLHRLSALRYSRVGRGVAHRATAWRRAP